VPRRHISIASKGRALQMAGTGASTREVAAVLGVDQSTVSRWTRGVPRPGPQGPCTHQTIESSPSGRVCKTCGFTQPPVRHLPPQAVPGGDGRSHCPEWLATLSAPDYSRRLPAIPQPTWISPPDYEGPQ
jgi:DNA-binding transcriptional regulator YdaS (Cro superfamily)